MTHHPYMSRGTRAAQQQPRTGRGAPRALRRLLHDRDADPRDRLAGCLLLLYGQPLTRTAALRTSDVARTTESQATITLGRGAIVLPAPLDAVALHLRDQRVTSTTTEWLMPGRRPDTHIGADTLRKRLKAYGINCRPSRRAAILALAARLPAPVLAERLGFDQARAAQWVRAAGGTYPEYVALRTQ